ncbi:hypothetical protein D9M71_583460 [compost metagenome]
MQQLFQVLVSERGAQYLQIVDQQGQGFVTVFQGLLDLAPQAVRVQRRAAVGRQLEGRVQVGEQVERLVFRSGQSQPRTRAGLGAGELAEQDALAIAQWGLEQGEAACLD